MSEHEKAERAAEWINQLPGNRISITKTPHGWVRSSCHIKDVCDSVSMVEDSFIISEAERLGWRGE